MIRATTGGVLRSYRSNLMKSFITDNKARETVLTQRVFNSYAEDPAAAAKSFRLRKSRMMTSSQLDICNGVYSKNQSAFAALQSVDELIDTQNGGNQVSTLKDAALRMLNDPTGDARTQLNKVLDNLSETIVQQMNQKYGDDFIFAGADGQNVPFEVKEVDGHKKLYYRGVPVDAAEPDLLKDDNGKAIQLNDTDKSYVLSGAETIEKLNFEPDPANTANALVETTPDGTAYYVKAGASSVNTPPAGQEADYTEFTDATATPPTTKYYKTTDLVSKNEYDAAMADVVTDATTGQPVTATINGKVCYIKNSKDSLISEKDYNTACQDAEKLDFLSNEKRFVDIGLGFQEDENGKLIESSAFNESLVGINFLGYGLDEDGDPKNIFSLVQCLKEIAANAPQEGKWDQETYDEFDRLVGKLEKASDEFKTQFTNQDAGTQKLENNISILKENVYNLKEQYHDLEDVDMADAITSFIWAEYCYNAALKVGNSILSQSLMDYLQ